eukprot:250010_1
MRTQTLVTCLAFTFFGLWMLYLLYFALNDWDIRQILTMDKSIYEFASNSTETDGNIERECITSTYHNYGLIYDCSRGKQNHNALQVVIVTINIQYWNNQSISPSSFITDNHHSYAAKHNYIYIQINQIIESIYFHDVVTTVPLAQKPIAILHLLNDEKFFKIDYILYIDYDILFTHCNTTVQSMIHYVHDVYPFQPNIIYANDQQGVNAGVLLCRNSQYTKEFMTKWGYGMKYHNLYLFSEYQLDQHVFAALLFGYDPYQYNQTVIQRIKSSLQRNNYWRCNGPKTCLNMNQKYSFHRERKDRIQNNKQSILRFYDKYLRNPNSEDSIAVVPSERMNAPYPNRYRNVWITHWAGHKNKLREMQKYDDRYKVRC